MYPPLSDASAIIRCITITRRIRHYQTHPSLSDASVIIRCINYYQMQTPLSDALLDVFLLSNVSPLLDVSPLWDASLLSVDVSLLSNVSPLLDISQLLDISSLSNVSLNVPGRGA